MNTHYISGEFLSIQSIIHLIASNKKLALSDESKRDVNACRNYLDEKMAVQKEPIYGINTGFGSLYSQKINDKDLQQLQENLVLSHACGTGAEVPAELIRLMLLLKIQSLSYGKSAVQLTTVERLIYFYNHDILPVIYDQGSLGASGDLAPLAHLSLPLLGRGDVYYKGVKRSCADVYKELGLEPIKLASKEGLALLNGTQFMSAYGVWCIIRATELLNASNTIAALSLEAFDGRIEPFHEALHTIRPHKGQIKVASAVKHLLLGSELISRHKKHVQDPYSFRCIPQVHGASSDVIDYVRSVFETEINSVTDNPTVFPELDLILSGGNFHGQTLAISLDMLCIAVHELGNISERRTYQLICGLRGLPAFLVANAGLNSGFMIPQYTAASIVSQNKQYCTPASADSIVSSNLQEDHVSMGANAATKCLKVIENLNTILGIELMNAAQALDFRRPDKTSGMLEELHLSFRKKVDFIAEDKLMHDEILKSTEFVRTYFAS